MAAFPHGEALIFQADIFSVPVRRVDMLLQAACALSMPTKGCFQNVSGNVGISDAYVSCFRQRADTPNNAPYWHTNTLALFDQQ